MSKSYYQGEGGVMSKDHPTYVTRPVDQQSYKLLQNRIYCFILNAHQMGKSSLMVRIIDKLKSQNQAKCVSIDIGTTNKESEETFYESLIYNISEQLSLKNTINNQAEAEQFTSTDSLIKFDYFIREIALAQIQLPLVIFLDEIQNVFQSPFQERFFVYIRDCHNRRATNELYQRLTFCLLGTANPLDVSEKIKDTVDTEYNIGEILELSGFEKTEKTINQLKQGLDQKEIKPSDKLINIILDWTGGHPFLTQRICQIVEEDKSAKDEIDDSEEYIKGLIEDKIKNDKNIKQVLTGIESNLSNHSHNLRLLETYQDILQGEETKSRTEYEEKQLIIIGLLTKNQAGLVPFNKIYSEYIFTLEWVEKTLQKLKPYSVDLANWNDSPIEYKDNFLLCGDERINKADEYREQLVFRAIDHRYVNESIKFWERVKELIPENISRVSILERIRFWTRGKKVLYNFIYKVIKLDLENNNLRLDRIIDNEERWIDNLVQDHLVRPAAQALNQSTNREALLDTEVKSDIEKIKNRLLKNPNIDPFWLLLSYRQILRLEEISFNESAEYQELLDLLLIIKDNRKFKVSCQFYRELFNKDWVEKKLLETTAPNRPYAKKLVDWVDQGSQFTHDSKLLQGEELVTALNWIQIHHKKKLRDEEYQFILTSIVWEAWNLANDVTKDKAVTIIKKYRDQIGEKTSDYYPLIQEILKWTKAQLSLLERLLELVSENSTNITTDVAKWLEDLIQSQFINNWQNSSIAEHIYDLSKQIEESDLSKLEAYAKILRGDDTAKIDQENLIFFSNLGLIIKEKERIEMSNRLYASIFDSQWIDHQISLNSTIRTQPINDSTKVVMNAEDKTLREVLNDSVNKWSDEIEGIFLVELQGGSIFKYSSSMNSQESSQTLFEQLYGMNGEGGAFCEFRDMRMLTSLKHFAQETNSGELTFTIFAMKERFLMAKLMEDQEGLPIMICYVSKPETPIGAAAKVFRNTITDIVLRIK